MNDYAARHRQTGSNSGLSCARIRVAVLEESDLLREGLSALLRTSDVLECVGTWSDAMSASQAILSTQPDVLLGDVRLLAANGFEVLRSLLRLCPDLRVIVFADCSEDQCIVLHPRLCCGRTTVSPSRLAHTFLDPDDCRQLSLKMGAHGAMDKTCSFQKIVQAIQSVYAGNLWMERGTSRRLAQQYLNGLQTATTPSLLSDRLTAREKHIAALIALGRSNKEIAQELQLGYSTVKNYVSSILDKLELRDRTQIAVFAADQVTMSSSSH